MANKEEHIRFTEGSKGIQYTINLIEETCTCPHFKYRTSHYPQGDERRWCKHLVKFQEELKFARKQFYADKKRFPRSAIENVIMMELSPILIEMRDLRIIQRFEFAGSWRRGAEMIGDIDVIIEVENSDKFEQLIFDYIKGEYPILWQGKEKCSFKIRDIQVDFRRADYTSWVTMLMYFTGSKAENIRLRKKAISLNMKLNEYGLWQRVQKKEDARIICNNEEAVYAMLKEDYVDPRNR